MAFTALASGLGILDRQRLSITARLVLLLLCGGLSSVEAFRPFQSPAEEFGRFGLLVTIAALSVAASAALPKLTWVPAVEAAAVAALVMADAGPHEALLPYLLAPALEAGLVVGARGAITVVGASAAVMLLARLTGATTRSLVNYSTTAAEWVMLALLVGLLAAWARRLGVRAAPRTEAYPAAYRLVTQLRTVSRHLSGGLDAVNLARMLLDELRSSTAYDRAAVFVPGPAGTLIPLVSDASVPDWDTSLTGEGLIAEAWNQQKPVTGPIGLNGTHGLVALAVPLTVGARTIGIVAAERRQAWAFESIEDLVPAIDDSALRIETALLFSEVRAIATTEERKRLAREIHDGIAQEMAFVGYVLDDLAARSEQPEIEGELRQLRGQITAVVSDLRLSIFELRSEVARSSGLGSLLSDFVRSVGAASTLTVHLQLDESPQRLPFETEAELLRVAQEAINNARKHAQAENLWVTCLVSPPRARVIVEDDGQGIRSAREDSYGMAIMQERAQALGARLEVTDRDGGGTRVEISLGGQSDRERRAAEVAERS